MRVVETVIADDKESTRVGLRNVFGFGVIALLISTDSYSFKLAELFWSGWNLEFFNFSVLTGSSQLCTGH